MKRNISLILFLLFIFSLSVSLAEWYTPIPPTAENIDDVQALSIATEHMAQMQIPPEGFESGCVHQQSPGVPSTIWQVTFSPREAQDIRSYAVTLDSVSGDIVAFGWDKTDEDSWDAPGYQTPDKGKEALERAQAEVCALFQMGAEALLAQYTPDVSDGQYQGVPCYQVYWLPKEPTVQDNHYYALVTAQTGTVVHVYFSAMSFG